MENYDKFPGFMPSAFVLLEGIESLEALEAEMRAKQIANVPAETKHKWGPQPVSRHVGDVGGIMIQVSLMPGPKVNPWQPGVRGFCYRSEDSLKPQTSLQEAINVGIKDAHRVELIGFVTQGIENINERLTKLTILGLR